MTDIKISIEFNKENKLVFLVKGNIEDELSFNDEVKTKINKLIEKSDTSNVLIRLNNNFTTELDKIIPVAFENAVDKEYKYKFRDENESE